jgi:hypothetical protein
VRLTTAQQKIFPLTLRQVHVLMPNLLKIFEKTSNTEKRFIEQSLLRIKINTHISDTPYIFVFVPCNET